MKTEGNIANHLRCELSEEICENGRSDTLFVPKAQCNMLSAPALDDKGFFIHFENGQCPVMKEHELFFQAVKSNGVYGPGLLNEQPQVNKAQARRENSNNMSLCHSHFAHGDPKAILDLQNPKLATGIKKNPYDATNTTRHVYRNLWIKANAKFIV
ncbi:hypothetical protein JRQ81_011801 [Phrynocephalus forsythii]|uniref:Uncharacterized protein n=1 Tax=Phrynocephalus forsythii TaxID=171643 RepID=A0A9Q0X6I2_9SAUR|nr:hypothetical protein JRQ81_011801 [Phrynocephalus forsythii]